jgi:predicted RNA-binding Zn ribbon-like protein
MMTRHLALELAITRHYQDGQAVDRLADVAGLASWLAEQADLLSGAERADVPSGRLGEATRRDIVELRQALRSLLARAVQPAPPSHLDAAHLLPAQDAVGVVNAAAARVPVIPCLDWPHDAEPTAAPRTGRAPAADLLVAELARSAIDLLTGPLRDRLYACASPACVRYFVREHGRQRWCHAACGNRVRVARHYQRHRASTAKPLPPG